jgi:hypothetical protein
MITTQLLVAIISSLFTAVIGPIAVHLMKERMEKRKKNDALKEALAKNALLATKVEDIKEQTKADRVWVMQFHNGGTFYPTGKSIQKFSMFYETVSPSIVSIQSSFQNIPVSLFSKSINRLLENDVIEIPDFKNDLLDTYGLKYIAEENGCRSVYLFAIKTIDGKFIGILGIDYVKKKTELPEDDINQLLIEATMLGGELMKH